MTKTNKADIPPIGNVYTNISRNVLCGKDTVRWYMAEKDAQEINK